MSAAPPVPKSVNIDALLQQRDAGHARLRFSPILEPDFREWFFAENRNRVFLAVMIGTVLFNAFGVKDYFLAPTEIALRSLSLRLLVATPVLLFAAWCLRYGRSRRLAEGAVFFGSLLAMVVVVIVVDTARTTDYTVPYEGMALIAMFVFYISGLRVGPACAAVCAGYVLHVILIAQADVPPLEIQQQTFFLLMSLAIGVLGAYALESQARAHYLQREIALFHADTDELTGLPNRRALLRHVRIALRQGRRETAPVALFMIDIDHFKPYNDQRGHVKGDDVLRDVAAALESTLKRPLDVVGRTGGEEFVALAYGSDSAVVKELGQRFVEAVHALNIPHPTSPHGVVTVSVGALPLEGAGDDPLESLLSRADAAMYSAKESGRNRCVLAQR